ncbi:hypothetical protein DPEC_G00152190 [Dallia pectoralis]|uniref:Uncharacterized protein n=1 Tax=Dallia pectoralis TaxID=75939 RepID=A0ACC2GJT2_DALPE|nr:hypothetical protein DPEC_G00152190 [Dallia pectoralis]
MQWGGMLSVLWLIAKRKWKRDEQTAEGDDDTSRGVLGSVRRRRAPDEGVTRAGFREYALVICSVWLRRVERVKQPRPDCRALHPMAPGPWVTGTHYPCLLPPFPAMRSRRESAGTSIAV